MSFDSQRCRGVLSGVLAACLLAASAMACDPASPQAIACNSNADCPSGSVCGAGLCRTAGPLLDAGTTRHDAVILDVQGADVGTDAAIAVDIGAGDVVAADAAVADSAPTPPVLLLVSPVLHRDDWVQHGDTRSFVSTVQRGDGAALDTLHVSTSASWLSLRLSTPASATRRDLQLDVDSSVLAAGVHVAEVTLVDDEVQVVPVTIQVQVRILDWSVVRIGPALDRCPHPTAGGPVVPTCEYWGPTGLEDALSDLVEPGVRLLLYDDDGAPFIYDGCLEVPGETWISTAPGIPPHNVLVTCHNPPAGYAGGTLRLTGDGVHLQGLTVVCQEGSETAITAWPALDQPDGATRGHLLEDLVLWAAMPELMGSNSIVDFVQLGADTVLRNSHVFGYFEGGIDLRGAHRTRIVHNTIVLFQDWGGGFNVQGAQDLVFSNNVVLALSRVEPVLLRASPFTSGLVVAGNVVEGFDMLVEDLDGTNPRNEVVDNISGAEGVAELESPLRPLLLVDSIQSTGGRVLGSGISLDGVELEGRRDLIPGAYQDRSPLALPRRTEVRVGEGDCGGQACDVLASEDNEIQRAVWSVWPGGEVKIYPSMVPYAGNAIVSWQQRIVGMSQLAEPDDVVLQGRDEDSVLTQLRLWRRHAAVLALLKANLNAVQVENLSIMVDGSSEASQTAIFVEGTGSSSPDAVRDLRRLKIVATQIAVNAPPAAQALLLGDKVRVQEVLIAGPFGSCIHFGPRQALQVPTPSTTGWVANLSCDLVGTGSQAPRAAFEVARTHDTVLLNLAVQLTEPAPLFLAQRRSTGDTGVLALDAPTSLTVQAVSHSGGSVDCDGFDCTSDGHVFSAITPVSGSDSLFLSASDYHLAVGSPALDTGVIPVSVDAQFDQELSLDSVSRTGRARDRGCYEQED
ncbi:MAG: right-handed parallel beta-helix repeat-containing protein [Pseudomonadota bacterium]